MLKCDEPLLHCAFNFNLRRCNTVTTVANTVYEVCGEFLMSDGETKTEVGGVLIPSTRQVDKM